MNDNQSIIPRIEWLHRLSTVDSDHIGSHGYDSWICPEAVCYAAYVSVPAVIVPPSEAASNFAAIWVYLNHLIGHTQPRRPAAGSMIASTTEHTTAIMPPAVADNELTHPSELVLKNKFICFKVIILIIYCQNKNQLTKLIYLY